MRETTAPENLTGLGMILDNPFASFEECFTSGGVIALMMKQNAPANGFSWALIVAPLTWLPTLAYRIDSTPLPHIDVPIVVDVRDEIAKEIRYRGHHESFVFDRSGGRSRPTDLGLFIARRAVSLTDEATRLERE